jgi:hypothetical protein
MGETRRREHRGTRTRERGHAAAVDFEIEDEPDVPPVGIAIRNQGPGPAMVRSLAYFVDGKRVKDWAEAATRGNVNPDQAHTIAFDPGDALAAPEVAWLVEYRKPRKANPKDVEHFVDFIDDHLAIEVTFCSVVDESACWTKCSAKKDGCSVR